MIIQSVLLQLLPVLAGIVTGGFSIFGVRHVRRQKAMVATLECEAEAEMTQAWLKDEDREYFETWDRILNIYTEPVKPPERTPPPGGGGVSAPKLPPTRNRPAGGSGEAKAVDPGVARAVSVGRVCLEVKRKEEWLAEQNKKALASIPSHDDVGDPFPVVDLRPSYARQIDKLGEEKRRLDAANRELTLAQAEARAQIQDHVDAIAAMKSIMEDVIAVHRDGQAIIIPEATLEIGDYPLLTSDDINDEIARLDQLRRRSERLQNRRPGVLVNLLDPVTKQPIAVPMSEAVCENGVWRMNGYEHTPRSTDS